MRPALLHNLRSSASQALLAGKGVEMEIHLVDVAPQDYPSPSLFSLSFYIRSFQGIPEKQVQQPYIQSNLLSISTLHLLPA